MSKTILIVDDHDIVRQGVRRVLRSRPEWRVVGEAQDGVDAIRKIKELDPDLVILDFSMPGKDGLEVIKEVCGLGIRSKLLILSMHDSKELALAVRKSGGSGYVQKGNAIRDLIRAAEEIFDGGTFFLAAEPEPAHPAT